MTHPSVRFTILRASHLVCRFRLSGVDHHCCAARINLRGHGFRATPLEVGHRPGACCDAGWPRQAERRWVGNTAPLNCSSFEWGVFRRLCWGIMSPVVGRYCIRVDVLYIVFSCKPHRASLLLSAFIHISDQLFPCESCLQLFPQRPTARAVTLDRWRE